MTQKKRKKKLIFKYVVFLHTRYLQLLNKWKNDSIHKSNQNINFVEITYDMEKIYMKKMTNFAEGCKNKAREMYGILRCKD